MRTVQELWMSRFRSYLKEITKYGKYVFNDHIKFFLVFAFGGGAYYYQQLLKTISFDFPIVLLISILFSLLVTFGNIMTFFKKPDVLFLLPLEESMKKYFIRSYFITYVLQSYILLIAIGGIYPLYKKFLLGESTSFLIFVIIIFLLKGYHLFISFLHTMNGGIVSKTIDYVVRYLLTFFFLYGLLSKWNSVFTLTPIIFLALYALLIHPLSKNKRVQWERNVNLDTSRLAMYYRFANMFTDVPSIQQQVKRRRWLDPIVNRMKVNNAANYLLVRTFVRNGNYLSMFLRQLLVGSFVIYLIPSMLGKLIIGILFLYLIGIQNMSIFKQYNYHLLWKIYPYTNEDNKKSITTLLYILLLMCNVIFTFIILLSGISFMNGIITLIVYLLFTVWFVKVYTARRNRGPQLL